MRWSTLLASTCAILALGARAIKVSDIKVLLTTATGGSDQTFRLQPNQQLEKPLTLEVDTILRLTFLTQPVPKHAHLEFTDTQTSDRWAYEIPVKGDGKARFDLKASALPTPLRRSSGRLSLSLSLSSPSSSSFSSGSSGSGSADSYTSPILTLTIPSKRLLPPPLHRHDPSEPSFKLHEEIAWTFRKEEKRTSGVVGSIAALVVVGQVGWLGVIISNLLSGRTLPRPSPNGYLFLGTLAGLEGLTIKYWINGRIYNFLPPFLALALISVYIGKNALRDVQVARLAGKLKA